jgi:hypothetical protein
MEKIVKFNRSTLNSIDNWIKRDDWEIPNSIFNYGLPDRIFHLINLPISDDITEVDMICNFCNELLHNNKKLHYLEIGVSVGKTFYQVVQYAKNNLSFVNEKSFSCIDIEKINPTLEKLFDHSYQSKSIKKIGVDKNIINPIRTDEYNIITKWIGEEITSDGFHKDNITYYETDEFDENIWKNIDNKFNVIFSDAMHDPYALMTEYKNIKKNNLLDDTGFIYCFDDLESNESGHMWNVVYKIYNDITISFPSLKVTIEHLNVNGWIGQYEHKHHFGVIKAL